MATKPPKGTNALAKTMNPEIILRANLKDLSHLKAAFEQPQHPSSLHASWFRPILTHALGALLAAVIGALVTAAFTWKAEGASPSQQCVPLPPVPQQHMPHKHHRS